MAIHGGFSRRELLKIAGAGTGLAALGGLPALRPAAVGAQDQKYAGTTLRGLTAGGGAYNPALVQFATEFEAQTGAKVEWDEQPWEQLMPKIQADLAAGSPTYDL